jgi:hypothetical protein
LPPHADPAPHRILLRRRFSTSTAPVFTIIDVKKRAAQAKKRMDGHRPLSTTTQPSAAASTSLSNSSYTHLPGTMDGICVNANGSASYSRSTGSLAANTGDKLHFVHPAPRPDLLTAPPPHQSSQPPSNGGAAPSTAGAGSGSNPPPHSDRLISFSDESGLEDNAKWTSLANAAIARAKAHVLPYRGKRVYPRAAEDIWLRGDKILDDLLDILPHCDNELRDTVEYYLTDVASITADMLEQCVRMPQRNLTLPQPTERSSCETTNSELRVFTQAADSTLQGQTADTVRVPASNADLPCDAPTDNHPDVLVPAMRGLQATATQAADTGDVQLSTTGSCAFNIRTLPRVSDTWSERPCCTARGQYGSPTINATPAPHSSTGDASSPHTPTAVTPVMHTAASGSAPGSTYGSATDSASGLVYGSASATVSSPACVSAPGSASGSASGYGSASTTPPVCMSAFTSSPAEKTTQPCDNLSTKMGDITGDDTHQPPLRLHDTTPLVITSTRRPGEEGSTGSQLHGFDPGGAAPPHSAAAPPVHRC